MKTVGDRSRLLSRLVFIVFVATVCGAQFHEGVSDASDSWSHSNLWSSPYILISVAVLIGVTILAVVAVLRAIARPRTLAKTVSASVILIFVVSFGIRTYVVIEERLDRGRRDAAVDDERFFRAGGHLGLVRHETPGGIVVQLPSCEDAVLEPPEDGPTSRVVFVEELRGEHSDEVRYSARTYASYDDLCLFLRKYSFSCRTEECPDDDAR